MAIGMMSYGPFGRLKWAVPFGSLNRLTASCWLRSFFDGDGDVHLSPAISKCRVRAKSVNLHGLESVKALLWSSFGIECKIYRTKKSANHHWSQAYELNIIRIESLLKYEKLVGFNHPAKRRKLRQVVEAIERNHG
jgi:hypothetical protein